MASSNYQNPGATTSTGIRGQLIFDCFSVLGLALQVVLSTPVVRARLAAAAVLRLLARAWQVQLPPLVLCQFASTDP